MQVITFIGETTADLRRQAREFADEGSVAVSVAPLPAVVLSPASSPGAASGAGASYAFVAAMLARIPAGRVARSVILEVAQASLRGESASYYQLRAKYAGDNGQRFAGYLQSITKTANSAGQRDLIIWSPSDESWSMSEDDARAVADLLGPQDS